MAVFSNADNNVVPDPAVYEDWFARTDQRHKRLAVGTRRFTLAKNVLGRHPNYSELVDPETGDLLSLQRLADESSVERGERVAKVHALIAYRREAIRQISTFQFELPTKY